MGVQNTFNIALNLCNKNYRNVYLSFPILRAHNNNKIHCNGKIIYQKEIRC